MGFCFQGAHIFLTYESIETMLPPYSDDLRLKIILHQYGEEQPVQEIAQNLNVSQQTVSG